MAYSLVRIKDGRPVGYITPRDYAERANKSYNMVCKMIRKGQIPVLKIGTDNWIRENIITYLDERD